MKEKKQYEIPNIKNTIYLLLDKKKNTICI